MKRNLRFNLHDAELLTLIESLELFMLEGGPHDRFRLLELKILHVRLHRLQVKSDQSFLERHTEA